MPRFIFISHGRRVTGGDENKAKGTKSSGRPRKTGIDDPVFPRGLFDAFGIKVLDKGKGRKSKIK